MFKTSSYIVLLLSLLTSFVVEQESNAANGLPDGFFFETVAEGLGLPTTMSFAPDGRIFVGEKAGIVRIVQNGNVLAEPFLTLNDVNDFNDRGLIGIAVDPDFNATGHVYIAYTYENNPEIRNLSLIHI